MKFRFAVGTTRFRDLRSDKKNWLMSTAKSASAVKVGNFKTACFDVTQLKERKTVSAQIDALWGWSVLNGLFSDKFYFNL